MLARRLGPDSPDVMLKRANSVAHIARARHHHHGSFKVSFGDVILLHLIVFFRINGSTVEKMEGGFLYPLRGQRSKPSIKKVTPDYFFYSSFEHLSE